MKQKEEHAGYWPLDQCRCGARGQMHSIHSPMANEIMAYQVVCPLCYMHGRPRKTSGGAVDAFRTEVANHYGKLNKLRRA